MIALILALAPALAGVAHSAAFQGAAPSRPGAADRNAIATITYQLTSRANAEARRGDARTRAMHREVQARDAALAANNAELRRARAEGARAARRIAALEADNSRLEQSAADSKERYTAELAARDEAYARERSVLAQNAAALVETSEGRRAIALINAGGRDNWQQGRDIIARLIRLRHSVELRALAYLSLDSRAKGLESVSAVIDLFQLVVREDPTVHDDWYQLAVLYMDANRIGDAVEAAEKAVATALTGRERARALKSRALALRMRGDLVGGIRSDRESLEILEKLLAGDPDNLWLQDEAADAISNVGDALHETGNPEEARRYYAESLARRRRIAELHPEFTYNQGGIANDLSSLGELPSAEGALCSLPELVESLRIRERMAVADPDKVTARALHSIGLSSVGRCMQHSGDARGAVDYLKRSLAMARDIAALDPQSRAAQSRLADVLRQYGSALAQQGDNPAALAAHNESVEILRRLTRSDIASASIYARLASSLEWIGDLAYDERDFAAAYASYAEALAALESITIDPEDLNRNSSLAELLNKAVEMSVHLGDLDGAATHNRKALPLWRRLFSQQPQAANAKEGLSLALAQSGYLLKRSGAPQEASAAITESLSILRSLTREDPNSRAYARKIASLLWELAEMEGTRQAWDAVVEEMESLEAKGMLDASDEGTLALARTMQAERTPR